MDELDTFISGILDQKQLPGLTDEARSGVIAEMRASLLDQVDRAVVEALPEDKLDEFNRLLDDNSVADTVVQNFIAQSGVNVQEIAAATMLRFRDLYLQGEQGLAGA